MKDNKSALVADYKERFIWLDGIITPKVAYQFKRMLTKMNGLKTAPIVFYIRGVGGYAHATFSMMSVLESSDSPVAIVSHGALNSGCFTITQASDCRLALPGTRFTFHPAECPLQNNFGKLLQVTQGQLSDSLERLRLIDAIQLTWFIKKGKPSWKIMELFRLGATVSLPGAIKLGLVDGYYKNKDFLKDRRIVRKMIRESKERNL